MAFTETDPVDLDQDRGFLQRMLQSMSDRIAGRTISEGVDAFTVDIDEPDPPMDPDELDQLDETVDDTVPPDPKPGEHQAKSTSAYAWGGHQNGRIPAKAMKAIGQGSHKLETTAAEAWIAMRKAAAAEGVNLALTDSYRSYDAQVSVRKRKGHKVATAKPGTSVHGWGRAVDANVNDPATLAWLRRNGQRFGWVNPAWAQRKGKSFEPWHWEFVGRNG